MHSLRPRSKQQKAKIRARIFSYMGVILLLLTAVGFFKLFQSAPLFQVKEVVVIGVPEREETQFLGNLQESVAQTLSSQFLGFNHYFSWSSSIELGDTRFQDISVNKKLFDRTIHISVTPKERFGIWCAHANRIDQFFETVCWWFDAVSGIAFEPALPADGQLIIKLDESRAFPIVDGEQILSDTQFTHFKSILELLRNNHISVGNVALDRAHDEVFVMSGRTKLIFNLRFDPQINLTGLQELLSKKPLNAYSIIDLTVKNKVYVTE